MFKMAKVVAPTVGSLRFNKWLHAKKLEQENDVTFVRANFNFCINDVSFACKKNVVCKSET